MAFTPLGPRMRPSNEYQEVMDYLGDVLLQKETQQQQAETEPVMLNYHPQDIGIPEKDEDITKFKVNPITMPWSYEATQNFEKRLNGFTLEEHQKRQRNAELEAAIQSKVITPEEAESYVYLMQQYQPKETTQPTSNPSRNPDLINGMNVDIALQAIAAHESTSKPGESKVGLPTSLRGTASGTYQMTDETKLDVYQNSFKNDYKSFDEFKQAFDTNPEIEYAAAKSLMKRHIENYGEYALGAWYHPEYARRAKNGDRSVFDKVPRPDYKNSTTWGDDFNKKRESYYKLLNQSSQTDVENANANMDFNPRLKSNDINYQNLDPRLRSWYNTVSETYGQPMITSANDSNKHEKGSKHYEDKAIDIRTLHGDPVGAKLKTDVINKGQFIMNTRRGPVYAFNGVRVLIENDHLHVSI